MKKRLLSLLLALVMVIGMLPATTLTANAAAGGVVYVGGVCMGDGDYLADGGTQTTKPSGGYAYYKDGVLTLHDYTVSETYLYSQAYDMGDCYCVYAGIFSEGPLTIQLEGKNSINVSGSGEADGYDLYYYYYEVQAIRCRDMVTVRGEGSLSLSSDAVGIKANGDIIIDSGTVNVTSLNLPEGRGFVALVSDEDIIINGGNVSIEAEGTGLRAWYGDCIINGGAVTICVDGLAVSSNALNIAEGLMVQASNTRNGALGEYVAANLASYKKIVVHPSSEVYVVGDINKDGTVNVIDVVLLKRSIASKEESSLDIKVADINGNGVINAIDVIQLKRNITGGYN